MKSGRVLFLIASTWISATIYAYGVFVGYIVRPGFVVHRLHDLFATLKAGYLQ
jgi:hypothetical protein